MPLGLNYVAVTTFARDNRIVLAYVFLSIADMMTIAPGADTRIELDAINSVTLRGLSEPCVLQGSDFICLIFSRTAFELRAAQL